MKAFTQYLVAIIVLAVVGVGDVWGTADYTYTLGNDYGTSDHTQTSGIITWTLSNISGDETYGGLDGTYGCKFGSGNKSYPTAFKLTSGSFSSKIKKVVVTASVNSSKSCKLDVKVGSTTYGTQRTINTKNNDTLQLVIADASAVNGAIELSFSSSTGPLYLKQIEVYYLAVSCTTNATVTAGSNSSVTTTTATVSCSSGISSLGSAGCSISSYGFALNTTGTPTISDTKLQVGTTYTTTGTEFSKDLTDLMAGTTYYVRPYATNGNGTAYGTQTSFTTLFEASITLSKNNSDVSGSSNGSAKAVENATSLSSLSAPTRTGYHVEGYYTTSECETKVADDAGKFIASITVSGNTWTNSSKQWKRNNSETFYAKWTVNSYSVRFNKNDAGLINSATGSMSNESYDYGESKALTSCGFSVVGYDFSGWATTSGGLVAYSDGQTVSNLSTADGATVDLYAKWTIKTYTVTWKVNDASWTPNTTTGKGTDGTPNVNHGSAITTMPTAPSTDDFCGDKFIGWTDAANGEYTHGTSNLYTKVSDFPNITSGDVIYYAVFADYAE